MSNQNNTDIYEKMMDDEVFDFWKEVKKRCIDSDEDISDYLEKLIAKDLKKYD